MPTYNVHPVYKQMRDLRKAAHLSLTEAQQHTNVPAIVLGSYERGDRQATINKIESILNGYGYTLVAIPKDFQAIRLPSDIAKELRAIADQLDEEKRTNDVPGLS